MKLRTTALFAALMFAFGSTPVLADEPNTKAKETAQRQQELARDDMQKKDAHGKDRAKHQDEQSREAGKK